MCDSLPDVVHFTLHHHIQYDIVNASAYERDTIVAKAGDSEVEQRFCSVPEALIWLFEKETGKQLKVKHYFSGRLDDEQCAK